MMSEQACITVFNDPNKYTHVHPLEHSWHLSCATSEKKTGVDWENCIQKLMDNIDTVEMFWETFNHIHRIGVLPPGSDYYFFKSGIQPSWEDKANTGGGKWTIRVKGGDEDAEKIFLNLMLDIIGEQLADHVNGIVCSKRTSLYRISIWIRKTKNRHAISEIGKMIEQKTGISGSDLRFQKHEDSINGRR